MHNILHDIAHTNITIFVTIISLDSLSSGASSIPGSQKQQDSAPKEPTLKLEQRSEKQSLAVVTNLGQVVEIFKEALLLEEQIFQKPVELETLLPAHFQQNMNSQALQHLGQRVQRLQRTLSETKIHHQRVRELLIAANSFAGIHNLDLIIREGKTPIGDIKVHSLTLNALVCWQESDECCIYDASVS